MQRTRKHKHIKDQRFDTRRYLEVLQGQTTLNQPLGEHQIVKYVRALKSAVALHHSIDNIK